MSEDTTGTRGLTGYQQVEIVRRLRDRATDLSIEDADVVTAEELAEIMEGSASGVYRSAANGAFSPLRGSRGLYRVSHVINAAENNPELWSRPRGLIEPTSRKPLKPLFTDAQKAWIERHVATAIEKALVEAGFASTEEIEVGGA